MLESTKHPAEDFPLPSSRNEASLTRFRAAHVQAGAQLLRGDLLRGHVDGGRAVQVDEVGAAEQERGRQTRAHQFTEVAREGVLKGA